MRVAPVSNEYATDEQIPDSPDPFEPVTDTSDTADEFLQKLDLAADRWNLKGHWIFRGQNDATWTPIPSLFRNDDNVLSSDYEMRLIDAFIQNVNIAGLSVPADSLNFETRINEAIAVTTTLGAETEPRTKSVRTYNLAHVAVALAQHSGIPTRLLDFTFKPMVAAYFAGCDIDDLLEKLGLYPGKRELADSQKRKYFLRCLESINEFETLKSIFSEYKQDCDKSLAKLPTDIAVWAIDIHKLNETKLRWLNFPYDQLLNLKAQMGGFIYNSDNIHDSVVQARQAFCTELSKLVAIDGIFKLTLPFSQRVRLSELLRRKYVSLMYLKPSYEKVAKATLKVTKVR